MTPHDQPQTLHSGADDSKTASDPGSHPVQSITHGKAEGPKTGPGSTRPEARERQPPVPRQPAMQPAKPGNRVGETGVQDRTTQRLPEVKLRHYPMKTTTPTAATSTAPLDHALAWWTRELIRIADHAEDLATARQRNEH